MSSPIKRPLESAVEYPATIVRSPDDEALSHLCEELAARADRLDAAGDWPRWQLDRCAAYGVHEWFLPVEQGGQGWTERDILVAYSRLAAACLTTSFILTQRAGACRRIAGSENGALAQRLLPDLIAGRSFATVGISHLTTSRRHLAKPAMSAVPDGDGFVIDGFSPWVTGARHAAHIVTGATLDDGRQILVALPTSLPGVTVPDPARLVGLSASHTGEVFCREVRVRGDLLLAGPIENVMTHGAGAGTGGLQTSALALGLSAAAIAFLRGESAAREDLRPIVARLSEEREALDATLLSLADCGPGSANDFRASANSLVLRATQAALGAAKGTGYVEGHPAGRWCREAMFFLVWSCPQPVLAANLCELAGLG